MIFVHVYFLCTQLIFQLTYQQCFTFCMKWLTASDIPRVVTVLVCDSVLGVGKMQTNYFKMNKSTGLLERYGYWEVTIKKAHISQFLVTCKCKTGTNKFLLMILEKTY